MTSSADSRLQALVAAERVAGEPSDADRERVWEGLQGRLVAAAPSPGPRARRWWRIGALAVLAGGAALVGTASDPALAPLDARAAIELPARARSQAIVPWQPSRASTTPARARTIADEGEDTAVDAVSPDPPVPPARTEPARRRRSPAARAGSGPSASEASASLAEQLELINAARRALERGEPDRARAHVDEYRDRFPDGLLREEADGIATAADCARGEDGAVAQAFTLRWPSSIHSKLVARFCQQQASGR